MAPRAKVHTLNFEQATHRLEEIVEKMDEPETGLEEMISLVEEGLKLIRSSRKLLTEAELKIQRLEVPADPDTTSESDHAQHDDFSLI